MADISDILKFTRGRMMLFFSQNYSYSKFANLWIEQNYDNLLFILCFVDSCFEESETTSTCITEILIIIMPNIKA